MDYLKASKACSPIGSISLDYMRMSELCRAANMRYNDITVKHGVYREWRIVSDPGSTGTQTSCRHHLKFCMLLDYIQSKYPKMSRKEVLNEAIDKKFVRKIADLPCNELRNEIANLGVQGYEPRVQSSVVQEIDFESL